MPALWPVGEEVDGCREGWQQEQNIKSHFRLGL